MRNWIRLLYVRFSSYTSNRSVVYGKELDDSKKPRIEIKGNKYLSPVKDNFTIQIYNLPYSEIIKIQTYKLFHVQIFASYLNNQNINDYAAKCLFDGGVINITNTKREYKDNIATFICGSLLMARGQEWKCSVSFNAGINVYSVVKYLSQNAGLTNIQIDESFKNEYLKNVANMQGTATSILDKIASTNNTYFMNTDASNTSQLTLSSSLFSNKYILDIDPYKGMMIDNAPEITSNGLTFTSLPVYNYTPGLLIRIDNSYIDVSQSQTSYQSSINNAPNTIYLNKEGLYYIFELSYNLSNTNGSFSVGINAKSKDLFDNVTGYKGVYNG